MVFLSFLKGLIMMRPLHLAFDLCVAEELAGLGMEEDGVVVDSVLFQDGFQLRPDRPVPFFVLFFLSLS